MNDDVLFRQILECIQHHGDAILPNRFKGFNSKPELREKLKNQFLRGRQKKHPEVPSTVNDDAVLDVLTNYFSCSYSKDQIVDIHKKAMASENIVGDILERYIASVLEQKGWVWAAGSVLKAIDFIYQDEFGQWILLQVKNRDNSENSSSAAIREGTKIKKWFRSFSKKEKTNWSAFPVPEFADLLSEEDFRKFVVQYVKQLRISKDHSLE